MRRRTGEPLRVVVVYQHLPHYRFGIFDALQRSEGLEVEFVAATSSRDGSIRTIDPALLSRFTRVENLWFGPFLFQRGLLSLLLKRRPHVVIFLGDLAYVSTWLGAGLSRALGTRVVFWTIGWHRPDAGPRRIARLAFYRLAHALMLYGDLSKGIGKTMGYPSERMFVVGNSDVSSLTSGEPSPEQVSRFESELPPSGMSCIGAVIRLNPAKRLDLIIEAAARLKAEGLIVGVLLVGEGPCESDLRRLATELHVPLFLPGAAYSAQELERAYSRIQVAVIPAVAGLTVLQSLRYGTPVITHDDLDNQAPESEAIISGVTGSFYRHGDVDDLATQVSEWLDNVRQAPDRVATDCTRSLAQHWSPESQASSMFGMLEWLGLAETRPE